MFPPRTLTSTLVAVLAAAAPAVAQTPPASPGPPPKVQLSAGVLGGAPLGDFGRNVDSAGGFSLHLDTSLGGSIVSVGGEVTYLLYGTEDRWVDLGPAIPELAGTNAKVTTDNAMILVHSRVRAQARRGRWRPYADGLFGLNHIYTETSIDDVCSGSDCSSGISATNLGDTALSVGGGAGVMICLHSAPCSIRLDVSVRYLHGGRAAYLTRGGIRREGGQAILDVSRSGTNMALVYVGAAFGR